MWIQTGAKTVYKHTFMLSWRFQRRSTLILHNKLLCCMFRPSSVCCIKLFLPNVLSVCLPLLLLWGNVLRSGSDRKQLQHKFGGRFFYFYEGTVNVTLVLLIPPLDKRSGVVGGMQDVSANKHRWKGLTIGSKSVKSCGVLNDASQTFEVNHAFVNSHQKEGKQKTLSTCVCA